MEFRSFGAFGAHLARLALAGDAVSHHIAEQGARIVEKDAKDRIGSYQDAAGPFGAWANLAPSTVDDRIRKGYTPDDPLMRSGGLRKSYGHKTQGAVAVVGSASPIALYMEQGTSTMPARAVVGPAAFASKDAIGRVAATTLIAWISGAGWVKPRIGLQDL